MVVHWDDVEGYAVERGELRGRFRDLGTAAGSFRAGAKLAELPPGGRSTPMHVHADEEEIFHILAGHGTVVLGDRAHPVGAGDCLLFQVHGAPHALVAGDEPLTYLAFGPRSEQNITWLPHAGMLRLGPHWVPPDAPDPDEVEAAAGPLPPRVVDRERPATIRALDDLPVEHERRGRTDHALRRFGRDEGAETTGLRHETIAPRARGTPHHCHAAEEELIVVLGGAGTLRLGEERVPVRRGSVVARPPGTAVAHSFQAGPEGLELLIWGTRVPDDVVWYPDSRKVFLCGIGVMIRVETLSYWHGED